MANIYMIGFADSKKMATKLYPNQDFTTMRPSEDDTTSMAVRGQEEDQNAGDASVADDAQSYAFLPYPGSRPSLSWILALFCF